MRLGRFLILVILICPILFANSITFSGTFKKGVTQRYCIKPSENVAFEARLRSAQRNCMQFLDSSGVLGERCGFSTYLYITNINKDKTYFIVTARLKNATQNNVKYRLSVSANGNMQAGVCPSDALAAACGMSGKQMSFMLSLSGLVIASMFFGSITYIILTIKEW